MISKGDIIEIDLILKDNTTKEVLDTTFSDLAKQNNLNLNAEYSPINVIFGSNELLKSVEENIKDLNVGQTKTFTLLKDQAFGDRDLNKIKLIPLNDFKKEKINPIPGMHVTIDNLSGKVISVSGGRVKVDFNPVFAGRDLEYTITLNKLYKEDNEKIPILLKKVFYFMKPEHISYKVYDTENTIEVQLPIGLPQEFDYFKQYFAQLVLDNTKFEKIKYTQVFSRKENK